jgi:hypothetical protein
LFISNECHKQTGCLSTVITKYDVCVIACKTYTKAWSAENLQVAFRKTGIYPLDEDAINHDYLLPSADVITQVDKNQPQVDERERDDESMNVTQDGDIGNDMWDNWIFL